MGCPSWPVSRARRDNRESGRPSQCQFDPATPPRRQQCHHFRQQTFSSAETRINPLAALARRLVHSKLDRPHSGLSPRSPGADCAQRQNGRHQATETRDQVAHSSHRLTTHRILRGSPRNRKTMLRIGVWREKLLTFFCSKRPRRAAPDENTVIA